MFDELSRDISTPERLVARVVNEGCPGTAFGIDFAARVVKGITHLDEVLPTWWREDHVHPIDIDDLDIGHGSYCVSAQLSGVHAFAAGRDMLGLTSDSAGTYVAFGFDTPPEFFLVDDIPGYDMVEAYSLLTCLWKNVIRLRRGMPVDPAS